MDKSLHGIRAVEDKYGLPLFRMALTHLIDVGVRNFSSEAVDNTLKQIEEQRAKEKQEGAKPAMSTEFQCAIIRCSAELSEFSIWEIITYIKKFVHVPD